MYKVLYGHNVFISLGHVFISLGVELLGHMFNLLYCPDCFLKRLHQFTLAITRLPVFSYPCQHLLLCAFSTIAILGCEVVSHCIMGLICIALMADDDDHLFICILAYSSIEIVGDEKEY